MPIIEITKDEAVNLIDFFDYGFIPYIRSDEDMDNMGYICSMSEVYKKLKAIAKDKG